METSAENWLRCNKCYRLMKKSARTFSLTQCQHVYCSICVVDVKKECPECKSIGVKTVPLLKPLPQQLLHYFGPVGSKLQQCLETIRFQRHQMLIACRRFSEIQGKYNDMKKAYYHSAVQKKSLMTSYTQLKEQKAKIVAEIDQLRSMMKFGSVEGTAKNPNFMRVPTHHREQQGQHMMNYVMGSAQPRINVSRNDTVPSSLSSSRSSLITPFIEQQNRHSRHQEVAQSAYQNRPKTDVPEYRYDQNGERVFLPYPGRVISSYGVPTRTRIPGSVESSNLSSTGGSRRHSPMVIDDYSNYCRS